MQRSPAESSTIQASVASDKPDASGKLATNAGNTGATARVSTERNAPEYNMNHKNRGLALIFHQDDFDMPSLKPQADVECENFCKALQGLRFSVSVHNNYKLAEIRKRIEDVAAHDHSENDCLLVAVFSQSDRGLISASDLKYKFDTIWHCFTGDRCPTLAGKPKLFIVQAFEKHDRELGCLETDGISAISYKIPTHADFLFSYSTIPGFFYIQSLIKEITENAAKYDILTLMTFVNQRMAMDFPSHPQTQFPSVTSMLTRICRFSTDRDSTDGPERIAGEYNMNHKNRGMALLFNHENFANFRLEKRDGTNVDCKNLSEALKGLGFNVSVYPDCKLFDILQHTRNAARQDHSDNDCILIAILSHGDQGYIEANDVQYELASVWNEFTNENCPTLAGKPKLFFVQACQGHGLDSGVEMCDETDGACSLMPNIRTHPDFLLAYSTIPGFYSWRHPKKGSWFMQSFINQINKNGKNMDLVTLLTFVIQNVALEFQSYALKTPWKHEKKQNPCVTTMLTRILRFNDKHNPDNDSKPDTIAKASCNLF